MNVASSSQAMMSETMCSAPDLYPVENCEPTADIILQILPHFALILCLMVLIERVHSRED